MKKLLTDITTIFTVLLLNTFGFALHVSAMPMAAYEMGSMNHETGSSATCVALCRTAVINKDEIVNLGFEEEDHEPSLPFYAQNDVREFSKTVVNQKLYADFAKPSSKVPIYILYSVFRV